MTFAEEIEHSSIQPDKRAAQVARQIEDEIVARRWPIGEILGSETELRERFGVSRSILRESIRLLEHHGIAQMRSGPKGGLLVRAPNPSPATRALVIYLEYVGTDVDDLIRARLLLEPLSARLAADRIDEAGILELRRRVAGDQRRPLRPREPTDFDFHATLAGLSGNALLELVIDVLSRLTHRYGMSEQSFSSAESQLVRMRTDVCHEAIGEAIIAGDAGKAIADLTAHLTEVSDWLRAHHDQGAQQMHVRPADDPVEQDWPNRKLGDLLASRLHDDIVAGGQRVGEIFGSESALLIRYGVSRSVLREAVRILEYHSVARMRRGHGGGLTILAPDPTASTSAVALYLDHRGVTPAHFEIVRETLEVGCLQSIMATGGDPTLLLAQPGSSRESPGGFHAALGELTGNPVLAVFLRMMRELSTRSLPGWQTAEAQTADEVRSAHHAIVEAMRAGDEGMARHRLRRHLAASPLCWR